MESIDLVTMATAVTVCLGYVCRVDGLHWRAHRLEYLVLHFALFSTAIVCWSTV